MSKRRKPQHASPGKVGRRMLDGYTRLADARHRLTEHGYAYDSYGAFLRAHGEPFTPARAIPWAPRMCFGNAIAFASVYSWRYVEGLAVPRVSGGRVFGHAWVETPDGEAIEVTWPGVGVAYLGVRFSVGRADDATWNGDACVLDDAKRKWPLLRTPWAGEDFDRVWPDTTRIRQLRLIALTEQGRQGLLDAGAPDPWPHLLAEAEPAAT